MSTKHILSKEDILHLAQLANLKVQENEIEKYQKQLEQTLEYVKNLNELDTKDIKGSHHTIDLKNIFFTDGEKNKRALIHEEALSNTKHKKNGYFVVERIL